MLNTASLAAPSLHDAVCSRWWRHLLSASRTFQFVVDFVSVFPLDTLALVLGVQKMGYLRANRLLRVFRLFHYLRGMLMAG